MVGRLRLALAGICAATVILVAAVAVGVTGANGATRPRQVVLQAPAAVAASRHAPSGDLEVPLPPAIDTPSTTVVPTTVAPLPVPPSTPPTTVRATPSLSQTVPTTVPRPAVTIAPTTAPAVSGGGGSGNANDFSVIGYRWNPCKAITVGSTGPDVTAIVSELASLTGLRLRMVSGTGQINVIWGVVPVGGGEIGLTAWRAVGGWLTEAGIIISHDAEPYLATVLRHELGHAVGLGHAAAANEIMYPTVGTHSPTDYQAGDRAGLESIGASAGC